jgi:NADH-quinone oxidoreductase subunit F
MEDVHHGRGTEKDIALLESVARNMQGKCLCALGEFATSPILSTIKHFLDEYKAKVRGKPGSAGTELEAAPQAAAVPG